MTKSEVFGISVSFFVTTLVFVLALLIVDKGNENKRQEYADTFHSYSIITTNGEDYNTDDIVSVDYETLSHSPDMITVVMKDGTVVVFSEAGYTLKDKK